MKKYLTFIVSLALLVLLPGSALADTPRIKLGNEVLMSKYHHLIEGKRVGLVTNQSGVNSKGVSTIDVLASDPTVQLVALYGPEHGIDGKAKAGAYVPSYTHPELGIPVYSLYGQTRMPTAEMLKNIDVLLFDIQDIGSRTYTYMSTLNYCMKAAQKYGKPIIVLDRPNPVGGVIVEGPVLEEGYETFVGVDNLPMAHGMTAGELARFFNRKIGADLTVIPMEGWTREMIYQDTGLPWIATSPNIPDIESVFGYMATGLGEGTGIFQSDKFKWIGGKGIDAHQFARLLNGSGLPGVTFVPEYKGDAGGVRLNITDYHKFNPAKTGFYALAYARSLNNFKVPKSGDTMVMFDKIMGTNKVGQWLEQNLTPQQIVEKYTPALNRFKEERKKYLIYGYKTQPAPGESEDIVVMVGDKKVEFDSAPFIDQNNRLMVPFRAIAEAMGAMVEWNPETKEIYISGRGKSLLFTLNSRIAVVDGVSKTMDTTPVIKNSRTMVPARYVGEFMDAQVHWDPDSRVVRIN